MATGRICDRCGAIIYPSIGGGYIVYGNGDYWSCRKNGEVKDLCDSCALKLKDFLEEEKRAPKDGEDGG